MKTKTAESKPVTLTRRDQYQDNILWGPLTPQERAEEAAEIIEDLRRRGAVFTLSNHHVFFVQTPCGVSINGFERYRLRCLEREIAELLRLENAKPARTGGDGLAMGE